MRKIAPRLSDGSSGELDTQPASDHENPVVLLAAVEEYRPEAEGQNGRAEIKISNPGRHPDAGIHVGVEVERECHGGERHGSYDGGRQQSPPRANELRGPA